MCGLCGILGNAHWTDAPADTALPARQMRLKRAALLNAVLGFYRLRVDDWQGALMQLGGPTGCTELVGNLAELWPKAETLAGRPLDPLDPALLAHLAGDPE